MDYIFKNSIPKKGSSIGFRLPKALHGTKSVKNFCPRLVTKCDSFKITWVIPNKHSLVPHATTR